MKREQKKNWGRERKLEQEKAKQIEILIEWKKEMGNNKFKRKEKMGKKIKNFKYTHTHTHTRM
jgi:hypothetical protein